MKILEDRKKLKALKRSKAMVQIGRTRYEDIFENLEGKILRIERFGAITPDEISRIKKLGALVLDLDPEDYE